MDDAIWTQGQEQAGERAVSVCLCLPQLLSYLTACLPACLIHEIIIFAQALRKLSVNNITFFLEIHRIRAHIKFTRHELDVDIEYIVNRGDKFPFSISVSFAKTKTGEKIVSDKKTSLGTFFTGLPSSPIS